MYEILISDTAEKQLEKLDKQIQERIIRSLERIRIRPEAYVERLVGDPAYKLRVGDYRVIMDISKEKLLVLVIKIGHRSRIYK